MARAKARSFHITLNEPGLSLDMEVAISGATLITTASPDGTAPALPCSPLCKPALSSVLDVLISLLSMTESFPARSILTRSLGEGRILRLSCSHPKCHVLIPRDNPFI